MRDYVDRRVTHQSGLPYRPGVPHPPCKQARKRQTSWLHIIFIEELSYMCLPNILFRDHVRFYFSLPLIFTSLAATISHFLTAPLSSYEIRFLCF